MTLRRSAERIIKYNEFSFVDVHRVCVSAPRGFRVHDPPPPKAATLRLKPITILSSTIFGKD